MWLPPLNRPETRVRSGIQRELPDTLSSIYSPSRTFSTHGRVMYLYPLECYRRN
jgi:hypothetical protein